MARPLESILLAERMRVSAIVESDEGKARPALALELALRSPMSAPAAIALLSKAAPELRNASASEAFAKALAAESIGLTSLGAEPVHDPKEKRIREIKKNLGKAPRNAE